MTWKEYYDNTIERQEFELKIKKLQELINNNDEKCNNTNITEEKKYIE
jgi:hypothetical protein